MTKSNSHKQHTFIAILLLFILGTWSLNAQCPTVSNPIQSFCDVESLLISDLQATDNGGGVVWYESATSTTPLPSGFPLTNGEDYFADDLVGSCITRPQVTVTIVGPPFGQNFQGFCIDDTQTVTLADLNAVGNDVQWYSTPFGGGVLPLSTPLVDGTTYYADQSNPDTGCRTSRLAVSVTVGVVPVPTGDSIQEFCSSPTNTPTVADLVATGANNWYPTPFSALPYPSTTPLVDGQIYYATSSDPPCESVGRFPVLALVVESPDPGTNGSIEICDVDSPFDLFNALGGTPDTGGSWTPALASGTGVFNPAVDSGGTYTYTVPGTSPCPDESAEVQVNLIIQPDAGSDGSLELCSNDTNTYNLFNALEGTPEPGGIWSPALASGSDIFDPSVDPPGTYTYTVGSSLPCPNSSNVIVQFTQAPNAGLSGSVDFCISDTATNLFNFLNGSPDAGGTWTPALASGTGVFNPAVDAPGVYTYTVAGAGPCSDDSAQVTVGVVDVVNAGTNGTALLCSLDTPIDLFDSLGDAPDTGGTWSPALSSGTGVFDPALDAAGIYTYTVAGTAPCPDDSAQVNVTVVNSANAGNNGTLDICSSDTPVDLFNSLGGTPDVGGIWSPALASGSGIFDPAVDAPGVYTYTVTGTAPCPDDSADVTVTTIAEVSAGDDGTLDICSSDAPIDLFNSLGGTPDTGGVWSPALASGTGVFDPAVDSPGVYTYTVSGTSPCPDDSADVIVTIVSQADAGEDGALDVCSSDAPVDLFNSLGGTPNTGGIWSPALASGTGIFDPAVDPPGVYTYTVSGTSPCPDDSADVTVTIVSQADAGEDGALDICSSDAPVDLFNSLGGTPDTGGTWSPALASGTGVIDPAVDPPGVYTYTVTGTTPCPNDSAQVTVTTIAEANAGIDGSIDICISDAPVDLFNSLGGTPDTGGIWSPALASGTGIFDPAVDPPGVYTYTVSGTSPCPDDSADVTVTIVIQADAGEDGAVNVCSSDAPVDLFSSLGGTPDAGGTWSPALASGTGIFDPAVDTPGVYTYTVSGTMPCPDDSSQVTVTTIAEANAGIDGSIDICISDAPVDLFNSLGGTPDTGGIWSPALASGTGIFDPTVDPPGVYTYTVSGTSPCPDDSADVTVTIVSQADAGEDGALDVCSSDAPVDLFNSLGGTPDAGGTWSPALASGTGIFDPAVDAPGVYTYTVGTNCTDSATVTVITNSEANAGENGSLEVCDPDITYDLFSSLGGTPETGGTWSPALASGTGVFDPALDAPGIYTYTVSGTPPCADASAEVTVSLVDLPNAGDNGSIQICVNDAPVDLFNSLGGSPELGGSWSPALASGTGVFDPALDAPGIYTYTVGPNSCGISDSAEVTVTLNPLPNAGENGTLDICSADSPVDLFNSLGGTPDTGGIWSPALASGTGIFDPTVDPPGVYTYTVSGTSPCPDDSADVTVTIVSQADAGEDGALDVCSSDAPVDLFNSLGGTPDAGGTWSPALASGTGIFDPAVDAPGVYTYTVGTNCTDSATVTVITNSEANAGENGSLEVCDPDITYDLFSSLGGTPETGGTWSPALASGTGVFDPALDAPGIYTYTVSGTPPCADASAEVTVSLVDLPNAGDNGSIQICVNDAPVDLFNSLGGSPELGGSWSPALASGTGVFDPALDAPGIYTYTVGPNSCGISDSAEVTVTLNPLPNAGENGTLDICSADSPVDLFNSLGGTPDTGGIWSPALASGTGVFDPAVDPPGVYTYTVGPDLCGLSETAEVTTVVIETPDIDGLNMQVEAVVCLGDPVFVELLEADNLSDGNYNVSFNINGANSFSDTINLNFTNGQSILEISGSSLPNTGDNTITITGFSTTDDFCQGAISGDISGIFNIEDVLAPELSFDEIELCREDDPIVENLNDLVLNETIVIWYDSPTSIEPLDFETNLIDGVTYYAATVSENGCESVSRTSVLVRIKVCDISSIIPDGFSPNGDTINDTFKIPGLREFYPSFRLFVYNRYGNIVYQGDTNSNDWDGTSNEGGFGSGILPVGVYFYVLEINDGENEPIQGRVYLNR